MKKYTGRTATAIIEIQPQKILLIRRDTVPFRGYWALPGGRAEPNENVEQAIVREVKEETGLDVEIIRKIGEYHEKGVQEGVEYDYYPACFLVKVVGGETKRQETEIQEIKLFDFTDTPKNLAFVHNDMIKDFLASRQAQPEE
ncbi:MAG TPA: NUDIX hydrolase [Candidatus Bathyarchaeia archaeon]